VQLATQTHPEERQRAGDRQHLEALALKALRVLFLPHYLKTFSGFSLSLHAPFRAPDGFLLLS
jgi:hypothetical protein